MKLLQVAPTFILTIMTACGLIGGRDQSEKINIEKDDSLIKVKYTLFKHKKTGVYYFQFAHVEPGSPSRQLRYIPIMNDNEFIKDINEEKFGAYYNFYTDDKYVFFLTDKYDFYKADVTSIDSLEKGDYYIDSHWRLSNGKVQYYKGRGILECAAESNQVVDYFIQDTTSFAVLDIQRADCAIIDGRILVNGCFLDDTTGQNKNLYSEINYAFKAGKVKHKRSW
jgi:hypothetical protein